MSHEERIKNLENDLRKLNDQMLAAFKSYTERINSLEAAVGVFPKKEKA